MAEQWPGDSPAAWIDDVGHAIAERYRRIEDALRDTLERLAEQHLATPDDVLARYRAIQHLREQAKRLVKQVDPDSLAKWATEEAASGASAEIARQLLDFPAYAPSSVSALTAGGAYAVAAVELDLRDSLRALNARILRAPVDAYQAMTSQHVGSLLAGMTTSQALHRRILDEYIAEGITGFIDKSGRRWTIGAYSEMATRTAAARAWRDQSVASMEAAGITTFTPVIGSSACSKCGAWQGKIITDGGPTGNITVPHAVTAEPTVLHVDGTLDQMRASGWGHPNCRCVLIPGLPGGTDTSKLTTHDPQKQEDREKLRALEREVRQAKRDGDPDEIGEAQAALRKHVDETGIIRREYREQLPFADGGDSNPRGRTVPTPPLIPREEQTWAQRQRRLGFQTGPGWELEQHEIQFYERFTDAGNDIRLIRKSFTGKPTNDFRWLSHEGAEIEVKRPEQATYPSSKKLIQRAVSRARENHGFTKARFMLDFGDQELSELVRNQLGHYNTRNPKNQIRELWVWSRGQLIPIPLQAKK
ncbi:phage minor capsid protein [Leucobacter sp. GX24907]